MDSDKFNSGTSARERRKQCRKRYITNRNDKRVYNEFGQIIGIDKDLCDCLIEDCPGCHFSCTKCGSSKCGHECRNNRKWMYARIETEGSDIHIKNNNIRNI